MVTVESLPLRGREEELVVIEDRLREVSAGTGGAIVMEGGAGVGKTKFIDASMQLASDLGFRVGRGGPRAIPDRSDRTRGSLRRIEPSPALSVHFESK